MIREEVMKGNVDAIYLKGLNEGRKEFSLMLYFYSNVRRTKTYALIA